MSYLPLLPLLDNLPNNDKPRLVGIARLASEGESLREGHKVEYSPCPPNRCSTAA